MVETHRKQTKSTQVLEQLRQDIIAGHFTAGEKLQMDNLKELYGVGFSPLREALSRLVSTGLVLFEEHCGFSVAPLSLTELQDLYRTRILIETDALKLSMELGDDQWESEVVACWHRYAKFLSAPSIDPSAWRLMEKEFTTTLLKACNSPWLLKIQHMLYEHAARYQYLCMGRHNKDERVALDYKDECERLVAAVLARDFTTAIELLQVSWQSSLEMMCRELQNAEIKA